MGQIKLHIKPDWGKSSKWAFCALPAIILSLLVLTCLALDARSQSLDSLNSSVLETQVIIADTTLLKKVNSLDTLDLNVEAADSLRRGLSEIETVQDSIRRQLSVTNHVNDTLSEIENYVSQLSDSLESLGKIAEVDQLRAGLIDSLRILDLPEELDDYLDSLSRLPNFHEKLIRKLGEGDTSQNTMVALDKVSELLSEEQENLAGDVLPQDFMAKLNQYKSAGDASGWTSKASDLIDLRQLELGELKKNLDLENVLNADLDFVQNLKFNGGDLSGKLSNFTSKTESLKDIVDVKSLGGNMDDLEVKEYADILDKMDPEEYDKLVQEYGGLSEDELDQRIGKQLTKVSEMQEIEKQTAALESMQSEHLAKLNQLKEQQKIADKIAQKKERVLANDIMNENRDLVEKAQAQTNKLIGKHVKLESGTDIGNDKTPSGNKKAIGKKFKYGLNFQLVPAENISLDLSPLLIYEFNPKISAGIGGTFRYEFLKEEKYLPDFQKEPVYGYRVFSQYKVISSFFIHAEWERMSVYDNHQNKKWENNYLAGIGKEVTIRKKLGFAVIALYNFNHKNNHSYSSPFLVRMGFKSK